MSTEVLLAKLLCLYIYEEFNYIISYKDLMSWTSILEDEAYDYVQKGRTWLETIAKKLLIYDKSLSSKSFYSIMMENLKKWGEFIKSEDGRREIYVKNNPDQWVWVVVDHLGLCSPLTGNTKKGEIDIISSMAVRFREICQVSFYMLMQQNRAASDMDRRKADLTELSDEDIKESGNPYNDCQVCIGIYHPLKYKLTTHKGYPIIVEEDSTGFIGLRDRYRAIQLIKNRFGEPDKLVPVNFFGEIGYWKELPKPETIKDFKPYTSLLHKESKDDDVPVQQEETKKPLTFSF